MPFDSARPSSEAAPKAGPGDVNAGEGFVGHYRIVREIGRGGMGVVYLAHDLALDREVALKTPRPDHCSADDRRRFLREARAAAGLTHPHIAPVFDVFEENDAMWVAMAYVDGQTFRALLDSRRRFAPLEVVTCAEGLTDALVAAHTKGLLHRDINPNNIMLTADGRPLLMDFGLVLALAREIDASASTHTSPALVTLPGAGTPAYMSPEQILGKPLDARSDLFSFGAVLYELCTGRHPFPATRTSELHEAILSHSPIPIGRTEQSPPVPHELERIIFKALAKRPDERYQSAADMLADVRALRRQMESSSTREDEGRPARHYLRHPAPWLVVVALVLAVAAWPWRRASGVLDAIPQQVTSLAGWEAEPVVSPDGSLIAYASDESGNADIWLMDARSHSTLQLTNHAAADRAPTWFPDGSALAFVSTRTGRPGVWKVGRLGGAATLLVDNAESPTIAPDGRRLAFVRAGASGLRRVFVSDLSDPANAWMVSREDGGLWEHSDPAWSPDGQRICYAAARDLWTVGSAGGPTTRLTTDGEVDFEPAWSGDGLTVYFSSYREGTLALWRVPSGGGRPTRVTMGTGPERHPSVSGDGSSLTYTTVVDDPDLVLRDLTSGEEQVAGSARTDNAPVFSPDGRLVAFVSDRIASRYDVWVQPLDSGRMSAPARRVTDHAGSVAQPSFSPDGRWIAYHRVIDGERDVWVVPVTGGSPTRFTSDPAVDIHPAWSPDGRSIAFVSERSGASHVWVSRVADGRPVGRPRQLTFGDTDDEAPVWSPDGRWIAFRGNTAAGDSDVWLCAGDGSGSPRRVTAGAGIGRVRWSQSGELLVMGRWNGDTWRVRRVSPATGVVSDFATNGDLGTNDQLVHFDVSSDERVLVFARANSKGDIWRLEARTGSY